MHAASTKFARVDFSRLTYRVLAGGIGLKLHVRSCLEKECDTLGVAPPRSKVQGSEAILNVSTPTCPECVQNVSRMFRICSECVQNVSTPTPTTT
eukprot:5689628-Pyramimonas_sp.AAC.1